MGKSSRTKRRASVRTARKSRGNGIWYAAAALVVVAGIALIVISRDDSADAAPQKGDHWHAALGVNVCGEWIPNAPEFEDAEGIHTHGDGLIHIHPFLSRASGENATVGLYLKLGGWEASSDSFSLWDGETHESGDECDGEPATVRWELNGEPQTGDISKYRPQNDDVIALALLPEGAEIGEPPSVTELAAPRDLPVDPNATTVPVDPNATTVPVDPGATPETTAPPAG
jgi:hypothetical protein